MSIDECIQKPEPSQHGDISDTYTALLFFLNNKSWNDDLGIRNTHIGLFVHEKELQRIAGEYAVYIRKNIDKVILTRNEVFAELVKLAGDELYYLVEQDFCWKGYIFPYIKMTNVKTSDGEVLSCKDYLHPKDTLENHPNIKLYDIKSPITAEFRFKDRTYYIHKHAFERFVKRTRTLLEATAEKSRLSKEQPKYLREFIRILYKKIKHSVPVERQNKVNQLLKYDLKNAEYRTADGWIFVIEEGNVLKTCYYKGNITEYGYKVANAKKRQSR